MVEDEPVCFMQNRLGEGNRYDRPLCHHEEFKWLVFRFENVRKCVFVRAHLPHLSEFL